MKNITCLSALLLFVTISAAPMRANDAEMQLTNHQLELIEKNILHNLEDSCSAIVVGTMQTLIELKTAYPKYDYDYSIIPLLAKLKDGKCEGIRIMAALTLYQLNSARGRFAVAQKAKFDASERVAKHCAAIAREWQNF